MTTLRQTVEAVLNVERDLRLLAHSKERNQNARSFFESTSWLDELIESIVSEPKPQK